MNMECCLICLNAQNKIIGGISANSSQWQAENIEYIIEKHLWPMDIKNSSDIVCKPCWQQLETFHNFYMLIEKAHKILGTKNEKDLQKSIQNINCDELKNPKKEYVEVNIEKEILIEQFVPAEFIRENETRLIKEYNETLLHDMPLKQKRRRGRPPKYISNYLTMLSNDPRRKKNSTKSPTRSKETSKNLKVPLKTSLIATGNKRSMIGRKKVTGDISNEPNNISLDVRDNSDFESENEDFVDKQPSKSCKKKRKNPDKKTLQEYDEMIAEHLKLFCSLCQMSLDNFITLRKHFREEHKRRGYMVCCKKKFFNRPILVDHLNFHLNPNYFKCKQCDKVYSDRCTLEKHIKIHLTGEQGRNHACNECSKSFLSTTQLENHKLTHAPDYEKKFSCSECGKSFTTLYNLNYHKQAIHRNKYVKICDICGKTVRNSFKSHMEKHDRKLSTHIHCDICGLRLIDNRSLKQHKNSQHPVGGKKEYSCHICSKISLNLRAHRTHVRFAHETGYTHKCTMCEKAFKRPEALKEHIATHTGTPLYTCPWCPKTFMSNGNMYNHRKNAHLKKWEDLKREKYICMYVD